MKNLFAFTCLFICTINITVAQETHFGLKAGINSSSVKITDGTDFDGKTGFHAGGLAHIHLKKHFAIQPELTFSTQGGKINDDNKLNLNYINLPVLVQYMFDEGFRLQTGPQVGFMVSAERSIGNVDVDVSESFSTVDFSWVFGASYLFHSGLGIDVRYNLGINDISDDNSFEARNRVLQAGLFYQFMHKKAHKH